MPKMKVPFSVCWGPFWLTDLVVVYSVEGELLSSLESPVLVPCCHDQIASWWHHLPFNTWGQDFNVCMEGHKNSDLYNWNNSSHWVLRIKEIRLLLVTIVVFFLTISVCFCFVFMLVLLTFPSIWILAFFVSYRPVSVHLGIICIWSCSSS